jgi:hypothetical protein
MQRTRNVNANEPNIYEGDRVSLSHLFQTNRLNNKKHQRTWTGPYVVTQKVGTSLIRLRHWCTNKDVKNLVNVAHVRRLRDEGRDTLYNKLKTPNSGDSTLSVNNLTVQAASAGQNISELRNKTAVAKPEQTESKFTA